MRFGFYDEFRPCLVKQDGVVDISELVGAFPGAPPQCVLETLINKFDALRSALQKAEASGKTIPMAQVRLRAPVPRPGKVLCGRRNFKEGILLDPPGPLQTFFKSPEAVIGPGETVVLPAFRASIFNHEAELALVIGKAAAAGAGPQGDGARFFARRGADGVEGKPRAGDVRDVVEGEGHGTPVTAPVFGHGRRTYTIPCSRINTRPRAVSSSDSCWSISNVRAAEAGAAAMRSASHA